MQEAVRLRVVDPPPEAPPRPAFKRFSLDLRSAAISLGASSKGTHALLERGSTSSATSANSSMHATGGAGLGPSSASAEQATVPGSPMIARSASQHRTYADVPNRMGDRSEAA
jgi:hypothetical protein